MGEMRFKFDSDLWKDGFEKTSNAFESSESSRMFEELI